MFWGTENEDIEVQSGDVFETLHTEAPPRETAQLTSYKIGVNRVLGETVRLKCRSLCKLQLYLVSESVKYQRLTWAFFICTSNCIQLYYLCYIQRCYNKYLCEWSIIRKSSTLTFLTTKPTTSHQSRYYSTPHIERHIMLLFYVVT
jgi:hypothetical protein